MAKSSLKSTETRDELQLPAILCQDARQRLMLHHYITASSTIINIVTLICSIQTLDTKRPVASLVKGGFVRYMPSPFYPSSLVLFQHHGGMVSHMQVSTHFS